MGAILTAFGVSVFFLVRGALLSGVEHAVRDRAEGVARTVDTGQSLSADDVERLTLEGVFVIVRDDEGRILARTVGSAADAGEPFWRRAIRGGEPVGGQVTVSPDERGYVYAVPVEPPELESLSRSPYFYKALTAPPDRGSSDGGSQPIFGEAARIPFPSEARVVEVGKSYELAGATVATFATLLAIAISAAFLVTAGGAYLLARAALSPVEAVVVSARGIGAGDLSKRLPVGRPKDEVGRLTATINDLLSRLEAAFARREEALVSQRRFVADASHQLRTPLTSREGYARMLRAWGLDDPETTRVGAEAIHRESRHMRKLVEGLLALARGDERAPLKLGLHDLDALAAVAAEVAADGPPRARGRTGASALRQGARRAGGGHLARQCRQVHRRVGQDNGEHYQARQRGDARGLGHGQRRPRGRPALRLRAVLQGRRDTRRAGRGARPLDSAPDRRGPRGKPLGRERGGGGLHLHAAASQERPP